MEIEFPIEFLVRGTPVSLQSRNARSRTEWTERIKTASRTVIPDPHFASGARISVTLYYLPGEPMPGDIDNIVKLILDALSNHIYFDDRQVERVVVQKFEPTNPDTFERASDVFAQAWDGAKPVLYIRVSTDPLEDLV